MSNLSQFTKGTAQWIAQEQLNELFELGDTTLVALATGLLNLGFEEVLAAKQSSFNLLGQSKRNVLNELQTNSAIDYITAVTLETQEKILSDINDILSDVQQKSDGLRQATQATPTYSPDKPSIAGSLENIQKLFSSARRFQSNPESAEEALGVLVTQGLVTQESLEEFLRSSPITSREDVVDRPQVVTELRERYYTVETSKRLGTNIKSDITPNFKIVDEDGKEIDQVSGYQAGELSPDGTISLQGQPEGTAQNASKTLRIQPETVGQRFTGQAAGSTLRVDTVSLKGSIEEELYYEIWACLILDIVSYLSNTWDRVLFLIDDLLAILTSQKSILRGTPFGPVFDVLENESFNALNEIAKAVDDIIPPSLSLSEILAIQNDLSNPGINGSAGKSICDFNNDKYCAIHNNLLAFLNTIASDLDAFNISLGGIEIGDLGFDLSGLLDLIIPFIEGLRAEADVVTDLIDDLKSDVCAFASRRMRGVPKSLSKVEEKLLQISNSLAAAPSFNAADYGINISSILSAEAAKLGKAGYTAAAATLLAGDIAAFLLMNETNATWSGQAAECLEEAANVCSDPSKAREMRDLANTARIRAEQKTTGQRIREGARRRKVVNNNVSISREIATQGAELIAACEKDRLS